MTPDLSALESLLAKATPGPWRNERTGDEETVMRIIHGRRSAGGSEVCIVTTGSYNDATEAGNAALIAAAVNALPALIARVRELESDRTRLAQINANMAKHDRAAALAMRERCIKACDTERHGCTSQWGKHPAWADAINHCAAAIRALEP